MTEQELQEKIQKKWNGRVFIRQHLGEGVHPDKRILECGIEIQAAFRNKPVAKTISFDSVCIPEDAIEKIARIIE